MVPPEQLALVHAAFVAQAEQLGWGVTQKPPLQIPLAHQQFTSVFEVLE